MFPASLLNALIQSVAALLIFVIGYFALLLAVILCLLAVAVVSKAARLIWAQAAVTAVPAHPGSGGTVYGFHLLPRLLASMNRHLAAAHKSGP